MSDDELRALLAEARAEVRRTYKELSESIAREAEAYERGAKAMRESAARYAEAECGFFAMSAAIRALPVPEER